MSNYFQIFFDSYRNAVEIAYDAYLKTSDGDFSRQKDDKANKLKNYLQNGYDKWLDTPLATLGDRTPVAYLETVNSLKLLTDMFSYGAVACDEELPEIFLDKLKRYGENAIEALLEIAAQNDAGDSEEELLAQLMAVKVLGAWKADRAVEPLIKLLDAEGDMVELMYETVRDALVSIGEGALEGIFGALDSIISESVAGRSSQTAFEYLVMALSDIGRNNRCEKIYMYLKKAFVEMEQKLVAASCLGNYGDGRAIPALRGYLEKNGQLLDKQTFYEMVSAIKCLGGRTDDLNFMN